MDWYSVAITEACARNGEYHRLCRRFQQAFIAAGAPSEMAMFAQTAVRDSVRKVYFSPGSLPYVQGLVEQYRGACCESPMASEVTLVFGVPGAEDRLLEGHDGIGGHAGGDGAVLYPVSEEVAPVRPSKASVTS